MRGAKKLIQIAKELNDLYLSTKASLPYSLNLIRELRAKENAHSRILCRLLEFSQGNHFPFLKSFIENLNQSPDCNIDISIISPILTNEKDNRIDILIKEKKSYAIIIENKIGNAPDQKEQIERYINYVAELGIPKRKIFVIYLTCDGKKKVSNISLTDNAKKILECTNKRNGRFICANFKDNIIPWLETLLNSEIIQNEPLLFSTIMQYSDYLKEKCGTNNEELKINKELGDILMNKLNIDSLQELLKTWDDVNELTDIVSETANNRIKSICEKKICKALEKKGYQIINYDFDYHTFLLEVNIPEWEKCYWVMGTCKDSTLFTSVRRKSGEKIAKKYSQKVSKLFNNDEDDENLGWDNHDQYELNDDFWLNIESHPVKFVNFIVREIEWIRDATDGIQL